MNYLRSAIVLASVSLVALVAGCNEGSDVTEDVAPSTEIAPKGLEPQALSGSVCIQDLGGSDKDAVFYQVQASRVAKYLFGGNDPFDTTGAGDSPEFGEAGKKQPDLGDSDCKLASEIIHRVHDKLYPPPAEKCDPKLMVRTKAGYVCPSPAPTASVASGALGMACNIPADSFGFTVSAQDTDWPDMSKVALYLDGCWGKGVSGFFWVKEGVTLPSNKEGGLSNILGTDPEPADLTAPLTGSAGATAAAVYTNTGISTKVLLWQGYFAPGSSAPAGTPCSTYGLGAGDRTSKQIVVSGSLRKCM